MTLSRATTLVFCLSLAAASSLAQQKPDFSGRWVLVSPKQGAGHTQVVKQTASTLSVGHEMRDAAHTAEYKLDGSESRNVLTSHGSDIVTISKAVWEGERLVVTSTTTYPTGRRLDQKQLWSMDADNRLVIEVTEVVDGASQARKMIYEKR
jgi:hypothetical protein